MNANRLQDVSSGVTAWENEVGRGERFRFGENCKKFAEGVEEPEVAQATADLERVLGKRDLSGIRFLDIGSGSGLHSVAAAKLGARIVAMDYDQDSVECTRALLGRYAPTAPAEVVRGSVLDADFMKGLGGFDIVYSWGVLHHTGDLETAMKHACAAVGENPGAMLAMALYSRTIFDKLWVQEKKFYSASSPRLQKLLCKAWVLKTRASFAVKGRSFSDMVSSYRSSRGMGYYRDVADWLGGYPYEAMNPSEAATFVLARGLVLEYLDFVDRTFRFSSGCDEYRFVRP